MNRRLGFVAGVICVITLLAGCTPKPAPTPTALFSSEAAAFKAAEQTYRAYVDALNKVDLSDPATFEDVYKWETGDALADEKKSLTQMHADKWSMHGTTRPGVTDLVQYSPEAESLLTIHVCMDIADVELRDADGESLVSETRPDIQTLEVVMQESSHSQTKLLIQRIAGSDRKCVP